MNKMENETYKKYASKFYNNSMFGGFPTQDRVNQLISLGITHFVDLTFPTEVQTKYILPTTCSYINFPILDRSIPYPIDDFTSVVLLVTNTIQNGNNVYIHCKGGHGRSGVLVAILLTLLKTNNPIEALLLTNESHNKRIEMREKWRKIGSPQTFQQKKFVTKFFSKLYFFKSYKYGSTCGFSTFSNNRIVVDNIKFLPKGVYPTAEALFQASKLPNDLNYIKKQQQAKNPKISKSIAKHVNPYSGWEQKKYKIMKTITELKLQQCPFICDNLLKSGMRPIVFNSKFDNFFGVGIDESGENQLGKILMHIRNDLQKLHKREWLKTKVFVSA